MYSMKRIFLAFLLFFTGLAGHSQFVPSNIFIAPVFLLLSDTSATPIHNFTVIQKDNKALLRWQSDSLPAAESFYSVERSSNGADFSLVGITKNTSGGWFEFLDDAPGKGKIFYRVKLSTAQTSYYSSIISATPSADASCKFYPNPVDKVLIVKSELGVDIQISDGSGKPVITEKLQGGLKVIDVSSLEPGILRYNLVFKRNQ